MSQKLPVNDFDSIEETSQFNEDFIKSYNEQCDAGYFLEFDVQYPKKIQELHNDLLFVSERIELGKVEKLVTNLHNKTEHVVHKRNLKQALNHGLILKNIHRVIKFNKKTWSEPYVKEGQERAKNYLVSETNYHTTNFFKRNLLAIEMKKSQ